MSNNKKKGVLKNNTKNRGEILNKNRGKYVLYEKPLDIPIGGAYDVYSMEKNPSVMEQKKGIVDYTFNSENNFGKGLLEHYGYDVNKLSMGVINNVKPSNIKKDYDGFDNYVSYIWDTIGIESTYAGFLLGALGVNDLIQNYNLDIIPNEKGKTAQDFINEIMQYTDIKYAMEGDKVGIVRNINVGQAVSGVVTTNINNYSGKETKMGLISNQMYGSTLLRAANFNSLRRNKYITPELDRLYGNNLNNVYNLSSLFTINDGTGRYPEMENGTYISDMSKDDIFSYLLMVIPEFKKPEGRYEYDKHEYNTKKKPYFDTQVTKDGETNIVELSKIESTILGNKQFKVYSEGDNSSDGKGAFIQFTSGEINTINGIGVTPIELKEKGTLIDKTNQFFIDRKINTIVSRFHDSVNTEESLTQSSVHGTFGASHGRNLLTKKARENGVGVTTNGYSNPYCRVWTNHSQFSKMKHLIRPFLDEKGESFLGLEKLQERWVTFRNEDGAKRLSAHSVLNKNGMVNITPTNDANAPIDVKSCMFSIENLAWKDVLKAGTGRRYKINDSGLSDKKLRALYEMDDQDVLSEEQRGPNGGRIMWFPPYDITFQETATAEWSENKFIGRGEPVYTYSGSNRSGNLEFTLLVDHPSIVDYWMKYKRNDATEDDEQSMLRFFAGCDVLEMPNLDFEDDSNSNSNDPKQVEAGTDIIFYAFFPNNFSGEDFFQDPLKVMDYLWGGQDCKEEGYADVIYNTDIPYDYYEYGEGEEAKKQKIVHYLGYEMGINPISIDEIIINEIEDYNLTVDKIIPFDLEDKLTEEELEEFKKIKEDAIEIEIADVTDALLENYSFQKEQIDDDKERKATIEEEKVVATISKDIKSNEIEYLENEIKIKSSRISVINDEIKNNPNAANVPALRKERETLETECLNLLDKQEQLEVDTASLSMQIEDKDKAIKDKDEEIKNGEENIETVDDILDRILSNRTENYIKTKDICICLDKEALSIKTREELLEDYHQECIENVRKDRYDEIYNEIKEDCDLSEYIEIIEGDESLMTELRDTILNDEGKMEELRSEIEDEIYQENYGEGGDWEENMPDMIEQRLPDKIDAAVLEEVKVIAAQNMENDIKQVVETALDNEKEKETINKKAQEEFEKTKDEKISSENSNNYEKYKCASPIEAYAKFLQNNIKKYDIDTKTQKPKNFLQNINDIICKTVDGNNKTQYWGFEFNQLSNIPFEIFENKNEFKKSEFSFGKKSDNTKYFVKVNNETKVFKTESEVNTAIYENELLITCENAEEFKTKGIPYAYDKDFNILAYVIKELQESDILDYLKKWLLMLCGDENGSETNEKSIEKFYPNINRFGSIESMKREMELGDSNSDNGIYGIIRLYITRKLGDEIKSSTIQDFIDTYPFITELNKITVEDKPKEYSMYYANGTVDLEAYLEKSIEMNTVWETSGDKALGYLTDKSKRTERLKNPKNYNDRESFGLNSTFEHVKEVKRNATFSFGEVYVALSAHMAKDELEKINAERNEKRLLNCVKAQLYKTYKESAPSDSDKDSNERINKDIEIKLEEVKNRIEYLKKIFAADDGDNKITAIEVMGAASKHGTKSKNITLFNNRARILKECISKMKDGFAKDITVEIIDGEIEEVDESNVDDVNSKDAKLGRYAKVTIVVGDRNATMDEGILKKYGEDIAKELGRKKIYKRYDNERLFFESLKENDSLAYTQLIDKVKYFSPAFHSVTPEGFNARLTFLHQCTRQGPTATSSDIAGGSTAANLAFGRAPFCILRLGDFLNTKIVIDSINITYPDTMWDLNHEGIGAQFMMAKVNMAIKILGGSDISAPIKRLQNAVSFNYYANTSIYDNRSDISEYAIGGGITDKKRWVVGGGN